MNIFLCKITAVTAFLCIPCLCFEQTLLSVDFSEQVPPVKTLAGSWEKNRDGISLGADSRIAMQLPATTGRPRNGSVRVGFLFPEIRKPAEPLEPGADDCFCALKINIGRYVAEFSNKGLFLKRMDPSFTFVDSVLGSLNRIPQPPEEEMTLSLTIADRVVTASVNDSIRVDARMPDCSLGPVEIATYRSAFELTTFSAVALFRDTLVIDKKNKCVDLAGVYYPSHFNTGGGEHNHSLVTWEGGTASGNALFIATVPDSTVYDALIAIGAQPGNNLTIYPWQKIYDPFSTWPDLITKGSRLVVDVVYGEKLYPAREFLRDKNGKPFNFRFAGNRKFISEIRSGCIVCLESCPAGKIGNAAYSMRDMIKNIARFEVFGDRPFIEGDEVTIRISFTPGSDGGF